MIIDRKTGLVTHIVVATSTGFKSLDDNVIKAGLQWRWKPATWKEFTFSLFFKIGKATNSFHNQRIKPMASLRRTAQSACHDTLASLISFSLDLCVHASLPLLSRSR